MGDLGGLNRGYTGHEHLDQFGIINMNGRVYDPLTAQFFSPDPVLTDAGNWLDYNRYGYCLNNPFRYTDPSGYTWWAENGNMVISTTASIIIGGVVAIATAGTGVPAMIASGIAAGAAGGFTGGAVSTAIAGGSFNDAMKAGLQGAAMGGITGAFGAAAGGLAATAVGNAIGSSFGGFYAGALQGAAGGAAGGFAGGSIGAWMNGASFGDGLLAGLKGAGMGAALGALIGGTIKGIDAVKNGKANFWDGHVDLDLSNGYGAENIKDVYKTVNGTYIGKFEGVNVFESKTLGTYVESAALRSGGITLPGRGITVGQGVFSRAFDIQLLEHEFGHILQAKEIGLIDFYSIIAPASAMSANKDGINGWQHKTFWTETWANRLSNSYFYHQSIMNGIDYYSWDNLRFPFK